LGALGHSVILKEGMLDFIHTHAVEADSTTEGHGEHGATIETTGAGPTISFATYFPEVGLYKIFTQFQHEGTVQTVNYTVAVE